MRYSIQILVNHGKECPYCHTIMRVSTKRNAQNQKNFPTRDHVIPKSEIVGQGVLVVCRKCNNDKDKRSLKDWYLTLKENGDGRAPIVKEFMKKNKHLEMKR